MNIWKIKPVDISYEESIPVINAMEENLTLDETQLDYVQPLPASYSEAYKKFKFRRTIKRKNVVKKIFKKKGALRVLDIGGGDPLRKNAPYLDLIKNYMELYFALDPSDGAWASVSSSKGIDILRKSKNPEIRFIKGVAENIPLEANSFDLIMMMSSLDHCLDADLVLKECSRLLKPEGELFIDLTNHSSIYKRLERKIFKKKAQKRRLETNKEHNYYLNPSELESMLINKGFTQIQKNTFQFVPEQVSFLLTKYKISWVLPLWLLIVIDSFLSILFKESGGLMHVTGIKPPDVAN